MKLSGVMISLALLFIVPQLHAQTIPSEVGGRVAYLCLWSEPAYFAFQLAEYPNRWFVVKEATVGTTNFDRLHAQILDALVHNMFVWAGTTGLEVPSPSSTQLGWEIYMTTIYRM